MLDPPPPDKPRPVPSALVWLCQPVVPRSGIYGGAAPPFPDAAVYDWWKRRAQRGGRTGSVPGNLSRGSDIPAVSVELSLINGLAAPYVTDWSREQANGQKLLPGLTIPAIAGFPVVSGSKGNFVDGGFPPAYATRTNEHYVGSFDLNQIINEGKNDREFISGPFRPTYGYLTMDLLLDKSARFSAYSCAGIELLLVDETSGSKRELLPLLRNSGIHRSFVTGS